MAKNFNPIVAAEIFGDYARRFKNYSGKSPNEVGNSEEYHNFLTMQKYIQSLTGNQILEMAEYYKEIFNDQDIKNSKIYTNLAIDYKKLKEEKSKLLSELKKISMPLGNLIKKLEK